jgi:hypothetical protein
MDDEADPYTPEALLRRVSAENAALRDLLCAVAGDLERLACRHPEHAQPFLARAMRIRRRVFLAG